MTRKDYKLIAQVVKDARARYSPPQSYYDTDVVARNALDALAETLADRLADDNPRFNRGKFLEATR